MGAKVSNKPENADYTFLYNSVETTKIYKQVYEEYKDKFGDSFIHSILSGGHLKSAQLSIMGAIGTLKNNNFCFGFMWNI